MRRAEEKAGDEQHGKLEQFVTVTSEDELYFRTIRTIHCVVSRLNSLNDVDALLELQNANGLVMSFNHVSIGDSIDEAGISA